MRCIDLQQVLLYETLTRKLMTNRPQQSEQLKNHWLDLQGK